MGAADWVAAVKTAASDSVAVKGKPPPPLLFWGRAGHCAAAAAPSIFASLLGFFSGWPPGKKPLMPCLYDYYLHS